jgi:hypothetical protein
LYNRALSSNEVAAIYSAGAAGKCKVVSGLTITAQPQSQTVAAGSSPTFTVAAAGTAPLSYQWQFNGTNLSGATNTSLTLAGVQPTNAGNYTVVVTNSAASATSAVAVLTVLFPPVITVATPEPHEHGRGPQPASASRPPAARRWVISGNSTGSIWPTAGASAALKPTV